MPLGLSVSSLISVTVNLQPPAAQGLNFNSLLIMGDSNIIDTTQRIRSYTSLSQIASDFGTTAPEYVASSLYFAQAPQPSQLYIGRWAKTATAAILVGGILTASQQTITNWNNISSGGVVIPINGANVSVSGLNFTAAANMNGVASVINTALSTNGTCTWNGTNFIVTSPTSGAGTNPQGFITIAAGNASNNNTVVINGYTTTFVTGAAASGQVTIGGTNVQSAANLITALQASPISALQSLTYTRASNVVTGVWNAIGTAGNAITLSETGASISVSAATLTGGTQASVVGFATTGIGTDISAQIKGTATAAQYVAGGINAESALNAVVAMDSLTTYWYALMFAAGTANADIADSDHLAIAAYIQADGLPHIYGLTTSEGAALSSTDTTSIGYQLSQLGYTRTFFQYSSSSPYAVASMFGRILTTNWLANNTAITLAYKQEPGITPEYLTPSQAAALNQNHYNYFAEFNNNTAIIVNGWCANGQYVDTVIGTDWLANYIQTNLYNLLYQSLTKVPQTDPGVHLLVTSVEASCSQAVTNGLLAPGTWTANGFGTLTQGAFLSKGYYVYAPPVATQSASARSARQSPVLQVAAKLAGAVQSISCLINVVN